MKLVININSRKLQKEYCSDKYLITDNERSIHIATVPGVPKKTIHCLISCNVKSIKAISLK